MRIIFKFSSFLLLSIFLLTACQKPMFNPTSPDYSPIVKIETTMGEMQIQLFSSTPKHRDNFIKLVKMGFYDSLLFHRVIPNFMVQGGDPDSKDAAPGKQLGMGGPGYTIDAELSRTDSGVTNVHIKGMLAAARMGDQVNPKKESSGSQFYIVQGREIKDEQLDQIEHFRKFKYTEEQRAAYKELGGTPHLDGEYTVFGKLIEGMEVLEKISKVTCNGANRPNEDVRILKMTIEKG
jgi:cyclophilin family peptidyl-prolyl cis-trans isomerase